MQEVAEAGFEVLETGPYGYFPKDPKELKRWTDEFGLKVVAGTGWGILHKKEAWAETEKTFRAIAETHAAVGVEYIVHLPRSAAMTRRGSGRTTAYSTRIPGSSTSKMPTSSVQCCSTSTA